MTRNRLAAQDGYVLATSIILLALMMGGVFAAFSLVDTSSDRSRNQRERETSLNLAEGVLYAQGFTLAQAWPGKAAAPAPVSCSSSTNTTGCPNKDLLAAANSSDPSQAVFNTVDTRTDAGWTTAIRDNGGPLANGVYDPAVADLDQSGTNAQTGQAYTCPGPCRWDANGDHMMWVQARAVVHGRARNVVATLRLEQLREAAPQVGVTAGGININNNGNKTMVWARGANVVVRCPNTSDSKCLSWKSSPVSQISPAPEAGNPSNFLTPQQIARFKQRAITDGTYYAGCPGNDLRGAVVFVDDCPSASFSSSTLTAKCVPAPPPNPGPGGGTGLDDDCINSIDKPGMLIWRCGRADFSGGFTYVGVVYHVNGSDGSCPASNPPKGTSPPDCSGNQNAPNHAVTMTGGFGIWGALAIDGNGCLYAGSNALQIMFDPNVFQAVSSYGTVGLVQNTWRELNPN